ncbi:MAG: glycosyltransferase family 1 protein [Desulfobulbaceae bacterium]|nr:MAG: glycosyltransferase family 1 protein [Desulfobulbaceae bacterium]
MQLPEREREKDMKIIQIGHYQLRRIGEARVRNEHKFHYGFIRNGHDTLHVSDRDLRVFYSPLGIRYFGRKRLNRKLIEGCEKFKPDMLMVAHCDNIENSTLLEIRRLLPSIRIAYRNFDALYMPKTLPKIHQRQNVVDHIFLSLAGEQIKQFETPKTRVSYIPNPVDRAIESMDNSEKTTFDRDLLFCGNGSAGDPRFELVTQVKKRVPHIVFETYGALGRPAVWGTQYDAVLAGTKMGLSLNRKEGEYLSSSTRLAQLMGNGILTFINEKTGLQEMLEGKAVFFRDQDDLVQKISAYHEDDALRIKVSGAGRKYYHQEFSSEKVTQYVVESTLGLPLSQEYVWHGR